MIRVLHPGLFTTIQDQGRVGFRNFGVPRSGAMDTIASNFGNALLNNSANCAQLEIAMSGPVLEFLITTNIVITGADLSPHINSEPIMTYKVYALKGGDILSFGRMKYGIFAYLSVIGGIRTEKVLGSRSQLKGISAHPCLQKGDLLKIEQIMDTAEGKTGTLKSPTAYFKQQDLECSKGPEFELFSRKEIDQLLNDYHTITRDKNRMGFRLQETHLPHKNSILTSPVLSGTIQLMPAGNCIVLMRDGQTTGGYPRILQLTENAISMLSQKPAGTLIRFKLIE